MPSKVLSTYREMAIKAPVLPADTAAWAWPDLTSSTLTRMEESFLRRKATSSGSCISTTSKAGTMLARGCWKVKRSGCPTSNRCASGWCAKNRRQASKVTTGPWSPPMQSTAKVIMASRRGEGRQMEQDQIQKPVRCEVSDGLWQVGKIRLLTWP